MSFYINKIGVVSLQYIWIFIPREDNKIIYIRILHNMKFDIVFVIEKFHYLLIIYFYYIFAH